MWVRAYECMSLCTNVCMYLCDPVRLRLRHLYQVEFCSFIVRYPTGGASVYCGHISSSCLLSSKTSPLWQRCLFWKERMGSKFFCFRVDPLRRDAKKIWKIYPLKVYQLTLNKQWNLDQTKHLSRLIWAFCHVSWCTGHFWVPHHKYLFSYEQLNDNTKSLTYLFSTLKL